MLRYLSVCSGIEAASAAWHPLGWEPAAFSEIEPFPSAVLAHHYPDVPNLGDFTLIQKDDVGAIDLLVGGTPCQDFSVAGLRAGLDGERGQLTLEFLRLLDRTRPRWVVWENVPGVLSSDGGRAFGAFLGGLEELGYGWAYRVLDAQFFGVPQRRRRVFVVGCLGDAGRAAAVLFERHSLSGHPAPRRKKRQGTTVGIEIGPSGGRVTGVSPTLDARCKDGFIRNQLGVGALVSSAGDVAGTLMASGAGMERPAGMAGETSFLVAHSPRTDGFDASEDSTDRGTPLVLSPYARAERDYMLADLDGEGFSGRPFYGDGEDDGDQVAVAFADVAQPVRTNPHNNSDAGMEATMHVHIAPSLTAYNMDSRSPQSEEQQRIVGAVYAASSAVRRLTPRECERLQGFPDDYTAVPYRGKPAADGPRYRALGNSMAVPVMRWIGERIAMIERDHLT